jgi:hypothetical protein
MKSSTTFRQILAFGAQNTIKSVTIPQNTQLHRLVNYQPDSPRYRSHGYIQHYHKNLPGATQTKAAACVIVDTPLESSTASNISRRVSVVVYHHRISSPYIIAVYHRRTSEQSSQKHTIDMQPGAARATCVMCCAMTTGSPVMYITFAQVESLIKSTIPLSSLLNTYQVVGQTPAMQSTSN